MPTTGCVCAKPGWCKRHQCEKSKDRFELCRTHPTYFTLWEQGIGPGQSLGDPSPSTTTEMPPLVEQVKNFVRDTFDFAKSGFETVSKENYEARLKVCSTCDRFNGRSGRCLECGCCSAWKAKGKVWMCPLGLWLEVDGL